ncbi:MAG: DinB family protein [Candidatus Thorarchaeota archaeon]
MSSEDKKEIWANNALLSQFTSSWKMLRDAIENCPVEYWYRTDKDWNYSKTVYHIIETQEFYLRDTPDGMVWGKLIGDVNNKDLPAEAVLPAKELLIGYLEDLENQISSYITNIDFEELLGKDGFRWFTSRFEKLLYLLRHNAHHLGELGRMLREWDCTRMKWQ